MIPLKFIFRKCYKKNIVFSTIYQSSSTSHIPLSMNKFNFLAGLIIFDITMTVFTIKYMGATELYPLFPFSIRFDFFILVKVCVSIIVLSAINYLKEDRYVNLYIIPSIFIYTVVAIWNLWQTANYLYY